KAREAILRELLETQKKVQRLKGDSEFELIGIDEIKMIRRYWRADGDLEDRIPKLYQEIIGQTLEWEYDDRPILREDQVSLLKQLCEEKNVSLVLIKKLIRIQQEYYSLKLRKGVIQDLEETMSQDWLHL
ncbi:MAG TPA: DNA phosphorothioation system sulfurtransferase DndC, partial [Bacilli bacterium]